MIEFKFKSKNSVVFSPQTWLFPAGEVGLNISAARFMAEEGSPCHILARINSSNDLLQLFLTVNALREMNPALDITLTLPYFPYSRQDRACAPGDPYAKAHSHEEQGAVQCLWRTFGGLVNIKGYMELHPSIGLIYGDSITLPRAEMIVSRLEKKGFASTNVVLGVGSYTYTHVTRDTLGFAMKATAGIVNGDVRAIFKDPKTDSGMKKSAKGFLSVLKDENGELYLKDDATAVEMARSHLTPVYSNGVILRHQSIKDIRARISSSIK